MNPCTRAVLTGIRALLLAAPNSFPLVADQFIAVDLMNKEPKRVRSFQKVVSRAVESLTTLRSLSAENGKGGQGGRALGYGVVDFEGNTNQSPFVRVRGKVFQDDMHMDRLIKFIITNLGIRQPYVVA